jgi:hypothetical protein
MKRNFLLKVNNAKNADVVLQCFEFKILFPSAGIESFTVILQLKNYKKYGTQQGAFCYAGTEQILIDYRLSAAVPTARNITQLWNLPAGRQVIPSAFYLISNSTG